MAAMRKPLVLLLAAPGRSRQNEEPGHPFKRMPGSVNSERKERSLSERGGFL